YRFWYATNLRRFFWSRTLVDGSPAAYTGHGRDLFLGFLVAIVLLAPISTGLSALSLLLPDSPLVASGLGFGVLFLLGQFALYRGQRYRATRTLWRGIRLGQDGSGLAYAALATAGWL
ncbi:YjgN family protein, partial [Acinetobacter baumannii]|nr:YjgN family protein [Acinetobacter baumannii]